MCEFFRVEFSLQPLNLGVHRIVGSAVPSDNGF
jgi:hypothetical protein